MTDLIEATPPELIPPSVKAKDDRITTMDESRLAAPLVLRMRPPAKLTAEQFVAFCQQNEGLRIERNAMGDITLMPPAYPETSDRNSELNCQLRGWAKRDGTGVAYDATGGFTLPNGAERSPDASWISKDRLAALSPEQRTGFWQICPDFVAELRSATDRLSPLPKKMEEYLANGARLGWLIDPEPRHVYIYRTGKPVERLDDPPTVAGDPVLPGFLLDAPAVFDTSF